MPKKTYTITLNDEATDALIELHDALRDRGYPVRLPSLIRALVTAVLLQDIREPFVELLTTSMGVALRGSALNAIAEFLDEAKARMLENMDVTLDEESRARLVELLSQGFEQGVADAAAGAKKSGRR